MAQIEIRPLHPADHDAWDALWQGYLAYYQTELPASVRQIAFDRLVAADTKTHGLLACEGGAPVGLVHYIYHDHLWRPEGVCYLQDLFTTPQARGKGVARALIKAVYRAADAAGVPRVYWLTQDFNTTARRLYDQVAKLSPFIKYVRP